MGFFLQVLGLVFLLGLVFVVGIVVFLGLKVRGMLRGAQQVLSSMPVGPPDRIHLRPTAAMEWGRHAGFEAAGRPLSELGFEDAGTFEVEESPGLILRAWVNPAKQVTAVVYNHPRAGIWLDLFTHFEDGTRLTFANTTAGEGVEHAPGHTVERRPDLDTKGLLAAFLESRPDRPARTITAETFAPIFERTYADEMAWRNQTAAARHVEAEGAEVPLHLVDQRDNNRDGDSLDPATRERLDREIRARFLEISPLSGLEWERIRDRLVIVHDRLPLDLLDGAVEPWIDDDDLPSATSEGPARAAFLAFNRGRPVPRRFEKLGEVDRPLDADIYCAPGS